MAKKSFEFMVDTIFENPHSVATVKQLDCATFNITVTENGFEKNLSNQTIIFYARKPDGKLVMQEEGITVTNATAGKLTIEVRNSVFQAVGYVVAELDIRGNDGEISTTNFIFRVSEKVGSNEAVHSEVDVNLFKEIAEYTHVCVEEITRYKTLFESFCEAGVSLECLNNIKAYIDNSLAGLKVESKKAEQMIPKVTIAINQAEDKRQEVETVTARAEDKRQEVQNLIDSNKVVVQEDLETKVSKAGDSMNGNLTFNEGCPIVKASDGSDVRLDFVEGGQARIRIGGSGAGTSNGFEIQGQGNRKLLRVDNTGQIFAGGVNKIYHEGNKPSASDVGAIDINDYVVGGNGILKDISGQDIKSITRSGRYRGNNCANAPTNNTGYYFDVECHSSVGYRKITAKHFFSDKNYTMVCNNGVWTPWRLEFNQGTFTEMMKQVYPVGAIYMSTSNTNPANLFGGTWEAWGQGRVPVGVNTSDTQFNSANLTGGSKTMVHSHEAGSLLACIGAYDGNVASIGYASAERTENTYNLGIRATLADSNISPSRVNHSTLVVGTTENSSTATSSTLQPYVTCFMWRRTAL